MGTPFIAGALVAAGAGEVACMWVLLVVVIGVHEAGHALAAVGVRFSVEEVVIGIGPTLARIHHRSVLIEIRSVPIVGWVASDVPTGLSQLNRRDAAFSAAGPLASFALAVLLLIGSIAAMRGSSDVDAEDAGVAVSIALDAAVTPVQLIAASAWELVGDWLIGDGGEHRSGNADDVAAGTPSSAESEATAEAVTVIGATAEVSNDIDDVGLVAVPLWAAAISAALAGFNLLPVPGLDGYRIGSSLLAGLGRRHRRLARVVAIVVTGFGLVLAAVLVIGLGRAAVHDLANLI